MDLWHSGIVFKGLTRWTSNIWAAGGLWPSPSSPKSSLQHGQSPCTSGCPNSTSKGANCIFLLVVLSSEALVLGEALPSPKAFHLLIHGSGEHGSIPAYPLALMDYHQEICSGIFTRITQDDEGVISEQQSV